MSASRRFLTAALVCLAVSALSVLAAAQSAAAQSASAQSDDALAEQVLGPQWQQLSRRAGMVFAGTVLSAAPQTPRTDRAPSTVELSFRVDRAIAGVQAGQILTIHEWMGAWSRHRPIRPGDHLLLFLYPPSRLGLTSPVGGSLGQIALDASGQKVLHPAAHIPISQLERAILAARGE